MFQFNGDSIFYNETTIPLTNRTIYIDGSLDEDIVSQYPHVYNSLNKAFKYALTDGTEAEPMQVYIAPYVYWLDDPEAADTLEKTPGYTLPYGMIVRCQHLHLHGLTDNPYQVVIAANRGQSNGANGNYTMFHFIGDGLTLENLTLGNYCNVDLDYPWNPSLSHAKRTSTITQAQLATLEGDKFLAINCNFISRLNLRPVSGGDRSLYYNCHFESTDDALNGYAVYEKCSFDFYGGRPLYNTYHGGAVFLDCDFYSKMMNAETEAQQFFTKDGGPVTAVDCRFHSAYSNICTLEFGWTKYPSASLRCYSHQLTHNGEPLQIPSSATVALENKKLLHAYRLEQDGAILYNTYQLLRGTDDWDPLHRKEQLVAAGADDFTIPTLMVSQASSAELISGADSVTLTAEVLTYTGETASSQAEIRWSISDKDKSYVNLTDHQNGTCTIIGCNSGHEAKEVLVSAHTADGLETAVCLTVKPFLQPAPQLLSMPQLLVKDGSLELSYSLSIEPCEDQSDISWYRCRDAKGTHPILTAISRMTAPETSYRLTSGDVGSYIMARLEPKGSSTKPGTMMSVITRKPISAENLTQTDSFLTDFHSFPHTKQPELLPGFWTADYFRPADTENFGRWDGSDTETPWNYGCTGNGCTGYGLYQGTQGARLMYTPVAGSYQDMSLTLTVDPAKTAGQGFGSADQYMDICIKFDTTSLSGYGLRIVRTRAASNAVSAALVSYTDGIITFLTEPVIVSCYQTGCTIELTCIENVLTAHMETVTPQLADQRDMGWQHTVDLKAEITPNNFGGIHIQHTGSIGTGGWQNTTMLHTLEYRYL